MNAPLDPIARFEQALAIALRTEPFDATAMTLATAGSDGRPSARVVLLKETDARGFVFYTNRNSRKGQALAAHAYAALTFHWPKLEQQVRIEGKVEHVSDEESDAYFATRPRGSQLGAWASAQSTEIASREELEAKLAAIEERFAGQDVPRPPHWGGYRVIPDRIEFWQGRPSRLHDRELYVRDANAWRVSRLSP